MDARRLDTRLTQPIKSKIFNSNILSLVVYIQKRESLKVTTITLFYNLCHQFELLNLLPTIFDNYIFSDNLFFI